MAKFIDNGIEKFASYLRDRNNLDHITYLKVRLGMQTISNNLIKGIVVYGVSLLMHQFLYTLTVHLSFLTIKNFAHGAHARSTLQCHTLNILFFIFSPCLILHYKIHFATIVIPTTLSIVFLILYAPAVTIKQPISESKRKPKKIITLIITFFILLLSVFFKEPYKELILLGIIIVGFSQLPLFFRKERI